MSVYKKQIVVNCDWLKEGKIIPISFRLLGDHVDYKIEKIISVVPYQLSLAGIYGKCWKIEVCRVYRNIYQEDNGKWYIESEKP